MGRFLSRKYHGDFKDKNVLLTQNIQFKDIRNYKVIIINIPGKKQVIREILELGLYLIKIIKKIFL